MILQDYTRGMTMGSNTNTSNVSTGGAKGSSGGSSRSSGSAKGTGAVIAGSSTSGATSLSSIGQGLALALVVAVGFSLIA